jgi:hypothetical protein
MPPGLVIIVAVLIALGMPRSRLRPSVRRCELPGQTAGLAAAVT